MKYNIPITDMVFQVIHIKKSEILCSFTETPAGRFYDKKLDQILEKQPC